MLINFFNKLEINFNYDIIENTQASFTISIKEIFPIKKLITISVISLIFYLLWKSFGLYIFGTTFVGFI